MTPTREMTDIGGREPASRCKGQYVLHLRPNLRRGQLHEGGLRGCRARDCALRRARPEWHYFRVRADVVGKDLHNARRGQQSDSGNRADGRP